jgi:hypothetical protein
VLTGLSLKPALQRRFEELARNFQKKRVEPLDGYETDTREAGIA